MTNKILDKLNDGVDLAIHLHNEATTNEYKKEKSNHLRYLGQCLKVMKEQIDDEREREQSAEEHKCGREDTVAVST
jgi:hypothetical protein